MSFSIDVFPSITTEKNINVQQLKLRGMHDPLSGSTYLRSGNREKKIPKYCLILLRDMAFNAQAKEHQSDVSTQGSL